MQCCFYITVQSIKSHGKQMESLSKSELHTKSVPCLTVKYG